MVVSYIVGLSKSIKNICGKVCIELYLRRGITTKILLMAPKDKYNITEKGRVTYRHKGNRLECEEEKHLRAPCPIYNHARTSGCLTKLDYFSIVGKESHTITRTLKEAMFKWVNDPSLKRNIGKYQLPNIWDEVICNIPGLHFK